MQCGKCGAEVPEGSFFCQNCGNRVLTYDQYARMTGRESRPIQPGTRNSATRLFLFTFGSLIACLIPLFGYPVSITGIVLSAIAMKRKEKYAAVCLVICVLSLMLTVINSVSAVRMAMQMFS